MAMRFICPSFYNCICPDGEPVSFSTLWRHRETAQARLRIHYGNPGLTLNLPSPLRFQESYTELLELESISNVQQAYINVGAIGVHTTEVPTQNPETAEITYHSEASSESESFETEVVEVVHALSDNSSVLGYDNMSDEDQWLNLHSDDFDLQGIHDLLEEYGWYSGFYLRHNATLSAMDDLIQRDGITRNWKTIRRRFVAISGIRATMHQFCAQSHKRLESDENGVLLPCDHSDCRDATDSKVKYFTYIHLRERISALLFDPAVGPDIYSYVFDGYHKHFTNLSSKYDDFFCGIGFRSYVEENENLFSSPPLDEVLNIFVFISTDGAPMFRSSTKSFWPVLLFIGNIPPDRRYEEKFIFPVMCIPGYPQDLDSFLSPLYDELEELHEGFDCTLWNGKRVRSKLHLMHGLSDLPAQRKLFQLKGFNSYCPCAYCKIRGQRASGKGTVYYPDFIIQNSESRRIRRLWKPCDLPIRSETETRMVFDELSNLHTSGTRADFKRKTMDTGIIGEPEIVRRFPSIRPYMSIPIDLMHLLFENIAPQMVRIWTGDVETGGAHSYLNSAAALRQVDKVLNKAGNGMVDTFRRPRGLQVRGLWKADEWRTFVLTTSLVALHMHLPNDILDGWYTFSRICDISMRPQLSEEDRRDLSDSCLSFYSHYSKKYYGGMKDKLHLMKYTIHLILHISDSTDFCGPLVCLSQFPTERYIGMIKGSTNAKSLYVESVAQRWLFHQAVLMCQRVSGLDIPLLTSEDTEFLTDRRSCASDKGLYLGYHLRGPFRATTIVQLDNDFGYSVSNRLERFYEANLNISRNQAKELLSQFSTVATWDGLVVKNETDLISRKYTKYTSGVETRSRSYFAGLYEGLDDEPGHASVYFGKIVLFLEHKFKNTQTDEEDVRILVLASWATRGLRIGGQKQIWCNGSSSSASVFSSTTVEDVRSILRNISVIQAETFAPSSKKHRTYFVDEELHADNLLGLRTDELSNGGRRLRGFVKRRR